MTLYHEMKPLWPFLLRMERTLNLILVLVFDMTNKKIPSRGIYVSGVAFLSVFLSVCLSICVSFCMSVCNADFSDTIIARATKLGMLIFHMKSANHVKRIFEIRLCFRDVKFQRFSAISVISRFIDFFAKTSAKAVRH